VVGRNILDGSLQIGVIAAERRVECSDNHCVIAGLPKKCECPARQCPFLRRIIVVGGDENDGKVTPNTPNARLHLNAIQTGHLHIQNNAIGLEGWKRLDLLDEFRSAGAGLRRHPE